MFIETLTAILVSAIVLTLVLVLTLFIIFQAMLLIDLLGSHDSLKDKPMAIKALYVLISAFLVNLALSTVVVVSGTLIKANKPDTAIEAQE
jgi:hypothetical protein